MKKTLFIIWLMVSFVSAMETNSNGEITQQDVYLNGEISQNCIIYQTSIQQYLKCDNCTAYSIIRDKTTKEDIFSGSMDERGIGTFYLNVAGVYLQENRLYDVLTYCNDKNTNLNGTVTQDIKIISIPIDGAIQTDNTVETQSSILSPVVNFGSWLDEYVKSSMSGIYTRTQSKLDELTGAGTIGAIGSIFIGIIKASLWVIKWGFMIMFFLLKQVRMLIMEPEYYISTILFPLFLTTMTTLISGLAIFFMFFECFIMAIALLRSNQEDGFTTRFFTFVNEFIMIHYWIVKEIISIIETGINITFGVVNGISNVVTAATTWIP